MSSKDLSECEVLYMTQEVNQNDVPLGIVVNEPELDMPFGICLFDTSYDTYKLLKREVTAEVAIAAINDIVNQIT